MNITCPQCGFSATIDPARIPAGGTSAGCPKCSCRFRVDPPQASEPVSVENLLVICPACKQEQPFAAECSQCGVIFARYRPPEERKAAALPVKPATDRKQLLRYAVTPALALLALLLLWILAKDRIPTTFTTVHETLGVTSGLKHSVAVRSDGTVWTWGDNSYGQLGNGRRDTGHGEPAKIQGIDGVSAVAAGMRHTLALKKDGSVWSWGDNLHCQLGDTTGSVGRAEPAQVAELSGVIAIAAGDFFSVALKNDGTIQLFGEDFLGGGTNGGVFHQLGRPRTVEGIADVTAISCGRQYIVALKKNGTVWCWGLNGAGQCGDGGSGIHWEPREVSGLDGVTAVAAGEEFALALKSDGTVWGWGSLHIAAGKNLQRQSKPAPIPGVNGVREIGAAYWMAVALRNNGTVWNSGADGKAAPGTRRSFADVLKRSRVASTSKIFAGGKDAFLEKRDGALLCWGLNDFGKKYEKGEAKVLSLAALEFDPLATATSVTASTAAEEPPPPNEQFQSIAAGTEHSLALGKDGTVWSWGKDEYGQLGRRWGSKEAPGHVTLRGDEPLDNVSAIAAGADQSLAVKADGSLWVWGKRFSLRMGRGQPLDIMSPTSVDGIDDAVAVAGGFGGRPEYIVLSRSGRVSLFGINETHVNPLLARPVAGLDDVAAVAAGTRHYAVLKKDGTVWTWGNNDGGQLGDGTTVSRSRPQPVPKLANVVRIAAGSDATLAVTGDGSLWGWGKNVYVTLPSGLSAQSSSTPVKYPDLTEVADASLPGSGYTNGSHYLAVDRQGSVWSWGGNFMGQLGQGTIGTDIVKKPAQIKDLEGVGAVAAGQAFALALRHDGSIRSWGKNFYGTLGSESRGDSALPVKVVPAASVSSRKP